MNFKKQKQKAEAHAIKVKQREALKKIRHKNDPKKKIPFHKIIVGYLFLVLNVVLIYAFVAMWHFADLTHLGLIITDIAAQIVTFLIYSHHSTAENTAGGIVYETAMEEMKSRFHLSSEVTQKEKDEAVG